jgi:SET domain-containing protein
MATPANPQKYAVDVQPSRIDGQGAFAAEAIPARRKIGEIRGDAAKSTDPLRYTNHSCKPNAVLRIRQGRVEFYAMRAIGPGEEITCGYGESHHEGRLACRCGAPGCVGRL